MGRFIEGADRTQATLLPEAIDDYVGEENPVRVVDAFVNALDLAALNFDGVIPKETGRPSCYLATTLKIYIYGYLNQVQSSRGLECECWRNLEAWDTGKPSTLKNDGQEFDIGDAKRDHASHSATGSNSVTCADIRNWNHGQKRGFKLTMNF